VLFFMRSTVYVRNFESVLRLLAERGHHVHVVAAAHDRLDPTDLIGRLSSDHETITHGAPPVPLARRWPRLGFELRRGLDYLRYLEPEYRDAPKLRRRAEQKVPAFVTSAIGRRLAASRSGRRLLRGIVRRADRAVPRDPAIDAFIRQHDPDLVLVTPLVEPGSPQSEYVRSARALGIRTGLCVYSWDNLTNKGLIHETLDVVTVWNAPMKDEAVALHGIPAERVVVTGAAAYDHWFGWRPRDTRAAFCDRVGLDAQRPYVLYLCSSKFIAPDELPFVRRWVETVRAASSTLRDIGVLVRPHPQNTDMWRAADLSELGNVAVWPRARGNPVDAQSRAEYFDSIYHSAAVVGVNTSALIESAIVGRGVFTLLAPEFRETQDGTLHFRHLREVNGGLLHVAADFEEHAAQLQTAVGNPHAAAERCRRFVEAFVRPYALDEAASPRLVAALEATAARGPARPDRGPWWSACARPMLSAAAAALERADRQAPPRKAKALRETQSKKPPRRAAASALETARISSDAYQHYIQVRDRARAMREAAPLNGTLTAAERQMVSALEVLWDARPEAIADLRSHSKAISGMRRSNYKGPRGLAVAAKLERDLRRLLEKGDRALWIEEPSALGGFGVRAKGRLYNEDTLQFFKVLSLLQDAGVLKGFRGSGARRTVWEIGGGWGGFAYQFKTVCPNVTYLITGTPELFLVSAVYLMTMFPGAGFRFYEPTQPDAFWRDWDRIDFAFAPESIVADMQPPSVELAVDLAAFDRMSPARVGVHVQRAYDLGSPYVLSASPAGDAADAASLVRPAVDRVYWPHPISVPSYLDRRYAVRDGRMHLGWRRLRV
jgi:hypothetical protein